MITIQTVNDLPHNALQFTRHEDGTISCTDMSVPNSPYTRQLDTSKPIVIDKAMRWAYLPLSGSRRTTTYPSWALVMAVAFGMTVHTDEGDFTITETDS